MYKLGLDTKFYLNPQEEKINTKIKNLTNSKEKDVKKLKKVCEEFEGLFIEKLWKEMKKTISDGGLFNNSLSNRYLEIFDYDFAMQLAKDGGIGLGNFLYNNLVKQLEQKSYYTNPISSAPLTSNPPTEKIKDNVLEEVERIANKIESRDHNNSLKKFDLPVSGKITSKFGWRRDPFLGDIRWHNGVDISAPLGSPVKAAMDGKVIFSGKIKGYGNLVIINIQEDLKPYMPTINKIWSKQEIS
jgi:murein DD-endopeptidase MepM/ murein hydrolase activator NlpD